MRWLQILIVLSFPLSLCHAQTTSIITSNATEEDATITTHSVTDNDDTPLDITIATATSTTTTITTSESNANASSIQTTSNQTLHIAGLYDMTSFPDWPEHLMKFTVSLINNKTDGWHDDVLTDGTILTYSMNNSACDPDMAVRSYLGMMRQGIRPSAIFGCRCSGASMAVARLCAVENIPMLSPASTSVKLSEAEEYSTFSRLVGPDSEEGQVGALITLLRSFGWDRISVINTDTQFTKDIALELSDAWKGKHAPPDPFIGEIAYTDTIKLNKTNHALIDYQSAFKVLQAVPTDKQAINSRVIVLFAHNQHAFPILKLARDIGFQPDTIWIGTSEWVGREPLDGDTSWMPPIPGYLGLAPYRNLSSPQYLDFLARLQQYERDNFIQPMTEHLADYVAERVVDGVLALAKAFSILPPEERSNGLKVSETMRTLEMPNALLGSIAWQPNGDFKDPRYMVMTMSSRGEGWLPIGFATPNSAEIAIDRMCYAEVGCTGTDIPDDEYPPAKDMLPFWIWIIIALLFVITFLLYYQHRRSISVTTKLSKIEHELAALENNDDAVKLKKGRLYKEIATLLDQPTPEHWSPGSKNMVVPVTPLDKEYWQVLQKLRETMTPGEDCHLSRLTRIQNEGIWSYYVFRKNQLANKYKVDMQEIEEAHTWHGTSSLNPDVIYRDLQDGFMMQLSQQGHWGRGIYFSERSGYSDPYAFKPLTEFHDQPAQQDRELFLVKLLVGEAIMLDRTEGEWMAEACKTLVTPPDNPNFNGYKFDTVTGIIEDEAKTKVYVVYENGRAYPEYLVRYYKGGRDERRTPFASWEDVLEEKKNQESDEPRESAASAIYKQLQEASSKVLTSMSTLGLDSTRNASASVLDTIEDGDEERGDDDNTEGSEVQAKGIWQYQDDNEKWINYLNGHQIQLETAYQQDNAGVTTIETFPWTYAVDFSVNLQTNLDHPERRTRKVRRIHIDNLDDSHRNPLSSNTFRFSSRRCTVSQRRIIHPEAIAEGMIDETGESELLEEETTNNNDVEEGGAASAEGGVHGWVTPTSSATAGHDTAAVTPAPVVQTSLRRDATSVAAAAIPPPTSAPHPPRGPQTSYRSLTTEEEGEAADSFYVGVNAGACVSGLRDVSPRDGADVAAGTIVANLRQSGMSDERILANSGTIVANLRQSGMSDEQAASIANSLAERFPDAGSVRSYMSEASPGSMGSLYPSMRDVVNAGSRHSSLNESISRANNANSSNHDGRGRASPGPPPLPSRGREYGEFNQ